VEYAYLRKEPDGSLLFETRNRTLGVDACEQEVLGEKTVEDVWVGPVGVPP
jgi:glucoamylase